ncbi:MAG: methyltransferase domain-containing protein [Elainella sp. Prado103]|jgi:malonyl-CoA O-methyltransferase|nr:methyltransferase domain-containing protein [Elainella sp. Prado103]
MKTELHTSQQAKQRIAERFGQAAPAYHRLAALQQDCAGRLLDQIAAYQSVLPTGTILEIGCGTGFLTQGLVQQLSQWSLHITDLSPMMLQFCRSHLVLSAAQSSNLQFSLLDGEQVATLSQPYAAIVSSFAFQWLRNPAVILREWLERLLPHGCLFLAFPTCHSYPEWRSVCAQLQLPCTVNALPDPDLLLATLPPSSRILSAHTIEAVTTHPSALDFFRSFKAIGAEVNPTQQHLTPAQLKSLIQYWDNQRLHSLSSSLQVHHQIAFWILQRLP